MLVARIWQALCDPVFGSIAENTRSRWGRYRPYILFGAPILALFNCLTFLKLDLPDGAKTAFCLVTYIICCTAHSVANGAVACVVNSMTSINEERVSANAVKGVVSSLAGMGVNAITMPLLMYFGGGNSASPRGYFMTALIFSICSLPFFYFCFLSAKEVVKGGEKIERGENVLVTIAKSFAGACILGIPVAGATLPVLAFLLLAIYGKNIILGAAVVILGIGHIGIHLTHRKEIEEDNQNPC